MKYRIKLIMAAALFMLLSCSRAAEPIKYGKDQCAHCKMTIMDKKYGCELITEKGKAFKFDDIVCMRQYLSENSMPAKELYVSNYTNGEFLPANKAVFLKDGYFRSPMNGNVAAFASEADAAKLKDSLKLSTLTWDKL